MSALRSPRRIRLPSGKLLKASYRSGGHSSVEGRRYNLMTRVQRLPIMSTYITMFDLWKRVNLMSHPSGLSIEKIPIPPFALTPSVAVTV